ncbi:DUF397 domain-containing protein [Embleya sp. AB8]|uniref:DUF397 domain-containing protein n=1 Tax=Embleya sp. AB8 TaxID=3156304 RepID=UPI003C74A377
MSDQNHRIAAALTSPVWRKSTYSGEGNACVETAPMASRIGVRDSKLADSPVQAYGPRAWNALTRALKVV